MSTYLADLGAEVGASRRSPFVSAADIEQEQVRWLWRGRIPERGMVALAGSGGDGKSTVAQLIAAHVTTGRAFPGETSTQPRNVLILSGEEDAAAVLVPRLAASGADLRRVTIRDPEDIGALTFPDDLPVVEQVCCEQSVGLLVIDPATGFMSPGLRSNSDEDVRTAYAGLARLAIHLGMVVLIVLHTNKAVAGGVQTRLLGSVAWRNLPRVVLFVAAPEGTSATATPDRVLAVAKSNLAAYPPAMGFRLAEAPSGGIAIAEFTEELPGVYADHLVGEAETPSDRSAREDAADWLRHVLADGPVAVSDLKKWAERDGHAWRTIERAKTLAGAKSEGHGGPGGGWTWTLPAPSPEPSGGVGGVGGLDGGDVQERESQEVSGGTENSAKRTPPLAALNGVGGALAAQIAAYLRVHPGATDSEVATHVGGVLPTAPAFQVAITAARRTEAGSLAIRGAEVPS